MRQGWNDKLEKEFKETIKTYFESKISSVLGMQSALEVGDNLAELLKSSEEDIRLTTLENA